MILTWSSALKQTIYYFYCILFGKRCSKQPNKCYCYHVQQQKEKKKKRKKKKKKKERKKSSLKALSYLQKHFSWSLISFLSHIRLSFSIFCETQSIRMQFMPFHNKSIFKKRQYFITSNTAEKLYIIMPECNSCIFRLLALTIN